MEHVEVDAETGNMFSWAFISFNKLNCGAVP